MAYRPTARTEARRLAARESLLRAARELLAQDGYRAASVAALAARAGVATGSVYRHFPSKAELLSQVFRHASGHEVEATLAAARPFGDDAPAAIAAAASTFARRALAGRRLAWALLAEPIDPAVEAERLTYRRAYADGFADLVRAGIDRGQLPDQPAELTAAALVGGLAEALVGPLSPLAPTPDAADVDRLAGSLATFALRAVGAPPHATSAAPPHAAPPAPETHR